MDPGWDGDVELHKGRYWSVSLCAGVDGSGGAGGTAGVRGANGVVSRSGGVGGGGGDSTVNTSKQLKMAACSKYFHCGDDFDAVLAIFCSYCYGENASEPVAKIATDEKDYHKCSSCVLLCIIIAYQ